MIVCFFIFQSLFPFLLILLPFVHAQNDTLELINSLCDNSCTFEPNILTSKSMHSWPRKCSTVCAELHIGIETDLSEAQMTSLFKNMKKLVGSLVLMRTKFVNASFLDGLEQLECDDNVFMIILNNKMTEIGMTSLKSISCRIHIASNKNMVRLNMPNLKEMIPLTSNGTYMDIDIQSLSPDFCITIEEMGNFMENLNVNLDYIPAKYCEIADTSPNSNFTGKICSFQNSTLTDMSSGCVHIRGDVIVESGDEEYVEKLESVWNIFGSLIIDGTNLTDIDFMGSLQYVAALEEEKAAIQIYNNRQLTNVSFPSLKRVRSDTRYSVVFRNNSEQLLMNPSICFQIRESLNERNTYSPTFDGKNCEWIELNEHRQKDKAAYQKFTIVSLLLLLVA